jgi:hypothetical protein
LASVANLVSLYSMMLAFLAQDSGERRLGDKPYRLWLKFRNAPNASITVWGITCAGWPAESVCGME